MTITKQEKQWLFIGLGLIAVYVLWKLISGAASAINPINWIKSLYNSASGAASAVASTASNAGTGLAVLADGGVDNYVQNNTVPALNADGSTVTAAQAAALAAQAGDTSVLPWQQ